MCCPVPATVAALALSLALLVQSFGHDVAFLSPWPAAARRTASRRAAAWTTTGLACLLVWFALVAPNDSNRLALAAFLRVPVEGLLLLLVVLLLPARARRLPAVLAGVCSACSP